jgi:8-oxo-dGTP pyrophosphatase MutT (NUDIX family)
MKVISGIVVILENVNGQIALQLRDDRPEVGSRNCWGLFGGLIEEGERHKDAALREIKEELSTSLDPAKLSFLQQYHHYTDNGAEIIVYVFHYPVTNELDSAILAEGQAYQFFKRDEVAQGIINGRKVAQAYLSILNWYWRRST